MKNYDVRNHYWKIKGTEVLIYSSAKASYVPETDTDYAAWLAEGNSASVIASEDDLFAMLLQSYVGALPTTNIHRQALTIVNLVNTNVATREFGNIRYYDVTFWLGDPDFGPAAAAIQTWAQECLKVAYKISVGVLTFPSVEAALATLPPFNVAPIVFPSTATIK